jgi:hypothetical protein
VDLQYFQNSDELRTYIADVLGRRARPLDAIARTPAVHDMTGSTLALLREAVSAQRMLVGTIEALERELSMVVTAQAIVYIQELALCLSSADHNSVTKAHVDAFLRLLHGDRHTD